MSPDPPNSMARPEEKEKYGEYFAIQEADVQTELGIERELVETMRILHRNNNESDIDELLQISFIVIDTLENAKNLLVKYIPSNAPLLVQMNEAVEVLKDYPDMSSILEIYSPLRDKILETFAFLGFRRAKNPTYKWTVKALDKMQMDKSPALLEELSKKKGKIKKFCHIVAASINDPQMKRDGIILITGDRGNGKTRAALRLGFHFKKILNRPFKLSTSIVYADIGDLPHRLLTEMNLLVVIDEGYFVAKNVDVLKKKVKDLTDTLSAVRNRGHIIIINFIKFNRAAKTLLEIANFWIHKPSLDYGILYIRDREFIGDDTWSVEDLLNSKYLNKKRWLMRHNPNYICTMKVHALPDSIFNKYEAYKKKAQEKKAQVDKLTEESDQKTEFVVEKLYQKFKNHKFELFGAAEFIEREYGIPRGTATEIVNKLKKKISQESLFTKMQAEVNIETGV